MQVVVLLTRMPLFTHLYIHSFDKFIKTAKVLTLLKSNSTSISISNRDVNHETLPTSRFEIEVKFDFKKNEMSTEWINLSFIYSFYQKREGKSINTTIWSHQNQK